MSDLPTTMRAVQLVGHGGLDKLVYREDVPVPVVGQGEVLVKVGASALNNTDINTRTSWYAPDVTTGITEDGGQEGFDQAEGKSAAWSGKPLQFPRIQGADVCGAIVAVGGGVDARRIGDRVIIDGWIRDPEDPTNYDKVKYYGSEWDGGFAEYTKIPVECAHAVRSTLSDVDLASFPCAYATSENLVDRPRVAVGDRVLITGASGGVGAAAIQLCKRRGATVLAMASESKHAEIAHLGADVLLPRSADDLPKLLESRTGTDRVDVVLDVVGGDQFGSLIDCLAPWGRYSTSGAIGGPMVSFNLRNLIYRDLEFYGATLLPPRVFANLVSYIEAGELVPMVGMTFPLERMREAQDEFLKKRFIGKIVIEIGN